MASGSFTEYQVEIWLNQIQTVWVSLHYSDPKVDGNYASEVFGGSYGRVRAEFSAPDARAIFNGEDIIFRGMPTIQVTHVGAWDAQYNGNMLYSVPLATPVTVLAGNSYRVGAESLAISLP
jgi:hypothetical protein